MHNMLKCTLAISIFVIFFQSCGNESSPSETTDNKTPSKTLFQLSESRIGFYLVDDYLKVLGSTKSPKQAQDLAYFSGLIIYSKNDSAFMNSTYNFHEGGSEMYLNMISSNIAEAKPHLELDALYTFNFNDHQSVFIRTNDWSGKLVKCSSNPDINLAEFFVNRLLLGRSFRHNELPVQFNPDGSIEGLDSLKSYYIHTDYMGPGMDFDMIDLWFFDNSESTTYGFEFIDAGMSIFAIDCKTEEEGMCVESIKGETKYSLNYMD